MGPELVAIATIERNQGRADLNGDGDTRRDVRSTCSTCRPLPCFRSRLRFSGRAWRSGTRYVTFAVRERTHFNQILNGDNDKIDDVLFCVGPMPLFP